MPIKILPFHSDGKDRHFASIPYAWSKKETAQLALLPCCAEGESYKFFISILQILISRYTNSEQCSIAFTNRHGRYLSHALISADLSVIDLIQSTQLEMFTDKGLLPDIVVKEADNESPFTLEIVLGATTIQLNYLESCYQQKDVEILLSQYISLCRCVLDNLSMKISECSLMIVDDVIPVSALLNYSKLCDIRKEIEETDFEPVTDLFFAEAARHPERICIEDNKKFTFLSLSHAALKIGAHLERNSPKGCTVAIAGEMSFGFVAAMLGTLLSGRVMLMIDSRWPAERKTAIMELAEAKVVLDSSGNFLDSDEAIPDPALFSPIAPDQPAYIFFTSGTTGTPKGILGCHKSLSHFIRWQRQAFQIRPEDRFAQTTSISFDVLLRDLFLPLCSGSTLVLYHQQPMLPWLQQNQINVMHTVPSLAQSFMASGIIDIPSLRLTFFAGEPLSDGVVNKWLQLNPEMRIVNFYGPTETTLAKCYYEIEKKVKPGIQPIGQAMPQAQAVIINPVSQKLCGIREIGEIAIRTPYTTLGYMAKSDRESPFVKWDATLIYKTGDLGRYNSDLQLEILGRRDHQVKVNGVRIELLDITHHMMKHPHVVQAVVSTYEDARGSTQLVGFYVSPEKRQIDEGDLKEFLARHLPYAMIPQYFCHLEQFPLLNNGKIDFHALKKQFALTSTPGVFQEGIEGELAQIYKRILGLETLEGDGDFFKLGGHSLLAVQLLSALKEKYGVEITFEHLFKHPTIKKLAHFISESPKSTSAENFVIEKMPAGSLPVLSSAQKRLYFLDQFISDKAVYHVALGLIFEGAIDFNALQKSVDFLISRHAALRTVFRLSGQEISPAVLKTVSIQVQRIALENSTEGALQKYLQNLLSTPFDLSQAPLVRFYLLRVSENKHLFFYATHHIISDGWSMELFTHELSIGYNHFLKPQTEPPLLPALTFEAVDFAFSQEKWIRNNTFEKQLAQWKSKLEDAPLLLPWDADKTRPGQQSYRGRVYRKEIPFEISSKILDFAKEKEVTLFMLLLTAYAILLRYYSRSYDLVIGSPVANRHYKGIENTISFFVNLLPIRLSGSEEESFSDLLLKVKAEVLESFACQDLPFDQLITQLNITPNLQSHPLCQATFVMQHEPEIENSFNGLITNKLPTISIGSKFDLSLFVYKLGNKLTIEFEYSTDLFLEKTIEKMSAQYQRILALAIDNPHQSISGMQLMTSEEYQRVVHQWNETEKDVRPFQNIVEQFEVLAAQFPDQDAVVEENKKITYGELNNRANQLACLLHQEKSIIALCLPRSIDLVVAIIAVLKSDNAFLVIESDLPEERRNFILEDSSAICLITHSSLQNLFKGFSHPILCLDKSSDEISQQSMANPPSPIGPRDLAYVIYTSGSTGKPKGTLLEHFGVVNLAKWQADYFHLSKGSCISQFASYSFDGAIGETFMALLNLGVLVIMPRDFDWDTLVQKVNENKIRVLVLTPSLLKQIDPSKFTQRQELTVVSVGEACSPELFSHWSQFCHFVNAYGPTEYTVYSHAYQTAQTVPESVPIGMPMFNTKSYVLNSRLIPLPPGTVGEIYLSGSGIARGYLNRPELTAERFLINPIELQKHYSEQGILDCSSARNEISLFEEVRNRQFMSDIENRVSLSTLQTAFQELDADLAQVGFKILKEFWSDRSKLRYIKESYCRNYASCGINEEVLRKILPFKDFKGIRGIDFGIGNGEVLAILKQMGAELVGLDMNPFFVQQARDADITAFAIEVDSEEKDFQKLELAASCDFAISTLVIDRLKNPKNFIRNFLSVLKPHGKFALQTLLPIVGIDDNGGADPIIYTPGELKIAPGKSAEEDKYHLLDYLLSLGCRNIELYQIPYIVVSRDAVQRYTIWSFCGSFETSRKYNPYFRMYRTGDLGKYLDNGNLLCLGRVDNQIKLRGFRIELQEVESVIRGHESIANTVLLLDDYGPEKELVAYLELNKNAYVQKKLQEAQEERVRNWQNISDDLYSPEASRSNFIGWNSSYTGQPLPEEEMKAWQASTLHRIKSLYPRKVLEIGCGTGLILSQLAPSCETYVALDVSMAALEWIKTLIQANPDLNHVTLLHQSAGDLSGIEGLFDVIIINSVIQYFPSQEYLFEVLRTLSDHYLEAEGSIFVGDVKNLELQQFQEASIAYFKRGDNDTASEFNDFINAKIAREEELFVAPGFFKRLPGLLPNVSQSKVLLKYGWEANELNLFRYDVILMRKPAPLRSIPWEKWSKEAWSLIKVEEVLRKESPPILALSAVEDVRLGLEKQILHWLDEKTDKFSPEKLEETYSPMNWLSLGELLNYDVFPGYHVQDAPGTYDLIFIRKDCADLYNFNCYQERTGALTNQPLQSDMHEQVILDIKKYLHAKLPDFMVPSKFAILERIPLGFSGKINRKAISRKVTRTSDKKYAPPTTPLQMKLHRIWQSLLRLDLIGIHDDFFSLGGHSLLATRLANAIRQELKIEIPLRSIFEYTTLVSLAEYLENNGDKQANNKIYSIPKTDYGSEAAASFAQERIWYLNDMLPDKSVYNMPMAFYLNGELDHPIFNQAFEEIINRQEMLRTSFRLDHTGLKQVIADVLPCKIDWLDLSKESEPSQQAILQEILKQEKSFIFDLKALPLFRIRCCVLNPEKRVLFLTFHHIVGDGWSLNVFSQELNTIYNALKQRKPYSLPSLPISYADFSHWQHSAIRENLFHKQINYWLAILYNSPKRINWQNTRTAAPPSYKGAVVTVYMASEQIKEFIRKENVTLFTFLLSVFSVTLKKYTHSQEFIIGIPVAGRHYEGVNDLIGLFINTLPLRIDCPSSLTFKAILQRMKNLVLEADAHQDIPFEKLVEALNLSGMTQHHPLFQVMFAMQNAGNFSLNLDNIEIEELKTTSQGSKFDLLLSTEEQKNRIKFEFEYSSDLFEEQTIDEMAHTFLHVISSVIKGEEIGVQEIPAAVAEEVKLESIPSQGLYLPELFFEERYVADLPGVVENKNGNEEQGRQQDAIASGGELLIPPTAPKTLVEAFCRTATEHPNAGITLLTKAKEASFISYAQLMNDAKRVWAGLSQFPSRCAILQLDDLSDYFSAFWGCLLGGIIPVTIAIPKEYSSRDSVAQKLINTWKLLEKPPIITSAKGQSHLRELGSGFTLLSIELLLQSDPSLPVRIPKPSDTAFYQLTSGSTGNSKCIQITHESIIAHIHGSQQFNNDFSPGISLNWIPMDHVVPILTFHFRDVYLGWNQIQVAPEVILENPLNWLVFIEKYRVTHSWSPNFGYQLVVEELLRHPDRLFDLSSLKTLMNAGEQVTLKTVSNFLKLLQKHHLKEEVMQPAFGMAEVCTCMTYNNNFTVDDSHQFVQKMGSPAADYKYCFIDLGPPIPGVSIRIVDKNNALLKEEQIGQLQIKGKVVTPGYINNPLANQEAFDGEGWFNSGDMGYISHGCLFLTGRQKEMVIINGNNYYCYDIESSINQIPGVAATYSAAVSVKNAQTETEELILFFSPAREEPEIPFELISQIASHIAKDFGVFPAYVIPISKQEFPKTTSGKIQRSQLRNSFLQGGFEEIKKAIDLKWENRHTTLPDWFFRKKWGKAPLVPAAATPESSGIVLFADDTIESQEAIVVRRGESFEKIGAKNYRINPTRKSDYELLIKSILADKIQISAIFHLWSCEEAQPFLELDCGVYSVLYLYQSLHTLLSGDYSTNSPLKMIVASSHSEVIHLTDFIIPERSGLHGLINTLNIEAPWLRCQHVDLDPGAKNILETLLHRCLPLILQEPRLALRGADCLAPRLEKVNFRRNQMQGGLIKKGGCYLVAGGLGGIGFHFSTFLRNNYQCKLILVGQSNSQQKRERLATLQMLDSHVHYSAIPISDQVTLQRKVGEIVNQWGCSLDGVINLCGSFHEEALVNESVANFQRSLSSKLFGLKSLYHIFEAFNAEVFLSFSSVNGYFGGNQVGAYSTANACEAALADYYRFKTKRSIFCFNFSLWDQVGISQHYQNAPFASARGFQTIGVEKGINSVKLGLHHREYSLYIGLDPTNKHMRGYFDRPYTRGKERLVTENAPKTATEKKLQQIWQTLLQVPNLQREDNFFSLGGHSILAMRLMAQIQTEFEVAIQLSSLFMNPTLATLAEHIDRLLLEAEDGATEIKIKRRGEVVADLKL